MVVPDPQENGEYAWRVRALLGTGISTAWSDPDAYVLGALPVVEGNVSPVNSPDTDVSDVVFDWAPVRGAVTYELQVDDDDSFSSPIDDVVVKGTRYSPAQTYNNNQYWWRVRARNIFGNAQEWAEVPVRQFRRHWPEAPQLTYPSDSATVGDDFYYQWTPVPLASRYRLEVGTDPNFSPDTYEWCYTTETTYTPGYMRYQGFGKTVLPDVCMPSDPGRTYYWRVQGLDGAHKPGEINGIFSSIQSFRYDPGTVRTLSPKGGVTVDVPTLRWDPAQDAVEYDVTLAWNGGSRSDTTSSYSWTPDFKLDPTKGPFEWTVRAVDANGDATAAPVVGEKFNLSGELPATGEAPLTPLGPTPGASATPRFPTLSWEPLVDAAYYKVHVARPGDSTFTTLTDRYYYSEGGDTSTTYLQAGTYRWFVTAHNSGGGTIGNPGAEGTFTISELGAAGGQKIALLGQGLDKPETSCDLSLSGPETQRVCTAMRGTPVLDWDPVPNAGYYMIYVSRDREFTNMVYGSKASPLYIPTTQNTRWNPVWSMPDSQAGDAYYWYIRPCKASGVCAPDPTSASHAFDKRSNQVRLQAPADAGSLPNEVTFTWEDYLETNQNVDLVDPNTAEQSSQAARSYHLQVGTTPAFTEIIDDVTVDQTTYTAFSKTYPQGTLHWRVQPVDGAGNKLTWSEPMEFTKASPPPALQSPLADVAAPTQPLRWRPLDFAASYDVEVYKNADRTASSGNRVLTVNSKQVAYSFTKPLAVGDASYVWRVRSVDADRRKGAWSVWGSFKVSGDAPVLAGPTDGKVLGARSALFRWDALAGHATSYKFERRKASSTYTTETVYTSNNAYAPTRTVESGSWRVTARDASGMSLGVSPWRDFTVTETTTTSPTPTTSPAPRDTRAPMVIKKWPLLRARVHANFVAVFNERVYNVSGRTMNLYMKGRIRPVGARVTLSRDHRTARLNPHRPLRRDKVYVLRLRSGVKDRAGNRLKTTSWRVRAR